MSKRNVVISAINLFEGGTLSILKDCLSLLNKSSYINEYKFIALVHKKGLFLQEDYFNIEFIEFPKSRSSYFHRLYYEYIYFKKFAKQNNVFFWLSLHDITPRIGDIPQAVYCHNPSPFNKVKFIDIHMQPIQFFFRLFYKYLYQINIKKNKYVIVQQLWIKDRFTEMFGLSRDKIIIAAPQTPQISNQFLEENRQNKKNEKTFFFPTFPRPFKNIEVICEAVKLVLEKGCQNFKVIITVDGSENKYSKWIYEKYKHIEAIHFIGLINREAVYGHYSKSDCLIFPSKLETWGLPISEFKQFNKPMLVADLPYAKETVGGYQKVKFFNPSDPLSLASYMIELIISNKIQFDTTQTIEYPKPYVENWEELFQLLIKI